jgi:hypothetical protein
MSKTNTHVNKTNIGNEGLELRRRQGKQLVAIDIFGDKRRGTVAEPYIAKPYGDLILVPGASNRIVSFGKSSSTPDECRSIPLLTGAALADFVDCMMAGDEGSRLMGCPKRCNFVLS